MKLGEMLVRDGRLTEIQLDAALRAQARDGGRLGTILVEQGVIDLDALTVYLGLELGIPIATGAMLERAKRAAVRLLQPAQAFKHRCVPLVVQDRQLVAAIEDPHDFATLDALAQSTGYRVLPRVAPELRIYYYVERYYGVPRPQRFVRFGDLPRGNVGAVDLGLPAPPLPGLPPTTATPVTPPGPAPRLASLAISQMFDDSEALELDASDLIDSLDAEAEASAEAVPLKQPEVAVGRLRRASTSPLAPDLALHELAAATDRNHIVEVLLGFATATFDAAIVFTVRDRMAFGWKAIGALPGQDHVEHLLIPLDAPSMLQAGVAAETGVFHGAHSPSTVSAYLYKVMQCGEPAFVTVGVIQIGKRVVNVLYGHGARALAQPEVEQLRQICNAAAEAYARLIAVSKRAAGNSGPTQARA